MYKSMDDNQVKLIDFGLSKFYWSSLEDGWVPLKMETDLGTAYFRAPEVIQNNYSFKWDIWSAGVSNRTYSLYIKWMILSRN